MTQGQTTSPDKATTRQRGRYLHKREVRWQIYLPFFVASLVILTLFIAVALLPQRIQVALVSDWMITILLLCPLVLCLFPIVLLVTVAAYGANRLHTSVAPPLERLEELTISMNERVTATTRRVNQGVIRTHTRLAPILHWMHLFMGDERIQDRDANNPEAEASSPSDKPSDVTSQEQVKK